MKRKAILTIFYGNDVLVNFDAALAGVLSSPAILRKYQLDDSCNYLSVWSTGTPESVSGETSLLAQVVVVPRVSHSADLRGNMQDGGRRTVACSRSRLLTSIHYAEECFKGGNVPPFDPTFRTSAEVAGGPDSRPALFQMVLSAVMTQMLEPNKKKNETTGITSRAF